MANKETGEKKTTKQAKMLEKLHGLVETLEETREKEYVSASVGVDDNGEPYGNVYTFGVQREFAEIIREARKAGGRTVGLALTTGSAALTCLFYKELIEYANMNSAYGFFPVGVVFIAISLISAYLLGAYLIGR